MSAIQCIHAYDSIALSIIKFAVRRRFISKSVQCDRTHPFECSFPNEPFYWINLRRKHIAAVLNSNHMPILIIFCRPACDLFSHLFSLLDYRKHCYFCQHYYSRATWGLRCISSQLKQVFFSNGVPLSMLLPITYCFLSLHIELQMEVVAFECYYGGFTFRWPCAFSNSTNHSDGGPLCGTKFHKYFTDVPE